MDGRRGWPAVLAGVYAVAVLATAVWVGAATSEDGSFAGIWLIALTLPGSVPVLLLPGEGTVVLVLLAVVGLLQALGTWWLLTRFRLRRRAATASR